METGLSPHRGVYTTIIYLLFNILQDNISVLQVFYPCRSSLTGAPDRPYNSMVKIYGAA